MPKALLGLLWRWRDDQGGQDRAAPSRAWWSPLEAGRDGFWLARWLLARGVEAFIIHFVLVSAVSARASPGSKPDRGSIPSCSSARSWAGSVAGTVKLTPKPPETRCRSGQPWLCFSLGARDLGPDHAGLRAGGSVLGGGEVIAAEIKEVVDMVVSREKPLCLAS